MGSGLAYFDVDIAPAATGHYHWTTLWMTVEPRHLQWVISWPGIRIYGSPPRSPARPISRQ
ncbi:hypothetical protein [Nocardia testacea]|uniref:hypothetical protein n=1 Tax=Nocardia testacea TaxID=248551 RepID=UPI00030460AF|nr:hypothetical protein [Nocardia testacea]